MKKTEEYPDTLRVLADPSIRNTFDAAADKFGRDQVIISAIEECGEFIQAASKELMDKKRDPTNLIEEAADVIITIANTMHELHSLPELNGWIERKMAKLNGKLTPSQD